jgi:hypothetical protein
MVGVGEIKTDVGPQFTTIEKFPLKKGKFAPFKHLK